MTNDKTTDTVSVTDLPPTVRIGQLWHSPGRPATGDGWRLRSFTDLGGTPYAELFCVLSPYYCTFDDAEQIFVPLDTLVRDWTLNDDSNL